MWNIFKNTMLKPLAERMGTALAGFIWFGGNVACDRFGACGLVTEDGALQVAVWVVGAAFVALDLAVAWLNRRREQKATTMHLLGRPLFPGEQ